MFDYLFIKYELIEFVSQWNWISFLLIGALYEWDGRGKAEWGQMYDHRFKRITNAQFYMEHS